ncbi:hypothetical protein CEXT_780721 [Caerostris extrusa]|uniref:Uncharacterized protein n=1 Tax=Caerostris extrusa TaxID=172846 RepID=A0AAV4TPC7_CAEEX|nr:hypothetical protein CEXT_780721 [Caerostris extrusa]
MVRNQGNKFRSTSLLQLPMSSAKKTYTNAGETIFEKFFPERGVPRRNGRQVIDWLTPCDVGDCFNRQNSSEIERNIFSSIDPLSLLHFSSEGEKNDISFPPHGQCRQTIYTPRDKQRNPSLKEPFFESPLFRQTPAIQRCLVYYHIQQRDYIASGILKPISDIF